MTEDEVSFAGRVYNTNLSSPYAWYYTNSVGGSITKSEAWWLISPMDGLALVSVHLLFMSLFPVNPAIWMEMTFMTYIQFDQL